MNERSFEYVDLKIEAEDFVNLLSKENELPKAIGEIKCGNVFVTNNRQYTFVCEFCHERFPEMEIFGIHLQVKHLHVKEEVEIADETPNHVEEEQPDCDEIEPSDELNALLTPMESFEELVNVIQVIPSRPIPANYLQCDICRRYYKNQQTLKYHKALHQRPVASNFDEKRFYCRVCRYRVKTKKAWKRHKKRHNLLANLTNFPQAAIQSKKLEKVGIIKRQEMKEEMTEDAGNCESEQLPETNPSQLEKDEDQKSTTSNESLSLVGSILSSRFDDQRFKCKICYRILKSKQSLTRHRERHRRDKIKLSQPRTDDTIPKRTLSETELQLIINRYCTICNKRFRTPVKFRDHADQEHGNEQDLPEILRSAPKFLHCKFCHEEFRGFLVRRQHETTHSGEEKPFRCLHCPKRFEHSYYLPIHQQTHAEANPYKCSHCHRTFDDPVNLNKHLRNHLAPKPFACSYCDMSFIAGRLLRHHERIHTKEKPYQCEECGESFRISGKLLVHRKKYHEKLRNYQCMLCEKTFFDNTGLRDHQHVHSDERQFTCDECGKMFPRKKSLRAHMQTHSAIKTYECRICGKRFAQCAGLNSHMKMHGAKVKMQ